MPEYGQPFNPYNTSYGIFIPAGVVESQTLTSGAKICFGVLIRHAGRDGRCYPLLNTIARQMGVSERQARRHLGILVSHKLIKRRLRERTSSVYVFLYHRVWEAAPRPAGDTDVRGCRTNVSGGGGHKRPGEGVQRKQAQLNVFQSSAGVNVRKSGFEPASKTLSDSKRTDEVLGVLRNIRELFPRSELAKHGAPDREIAKRIVFALGDQSTADWDKHCIRPRFTNEHRSPYDERGPKKWAMFELWARDFAGDR